MKLVSRQAATGSSYAHGKWRQSRPARSLFNTPTTQLPLVYHWYKHSCKARCQSEKCEWDWRTSDHPFWKHFPALPVSDACRQAESNCKGSCAPQEHPSEGQLWVIPGTGLHTEAFGSFRLLGYLVLFPIEGQEQEEEQGHQLGTQCQHCHLVQENSQRGPK